MYDYNTQQHSVWECKYHIVFVPKYRRKSMYSAIRKDLGLIFKRLVQQKECALEEGKIMPDHVHMLLSIPPKYSVSHVVGFIKGKSAIAIAREYRGRTKNFAGERFWARGYFVSTVGRDEALIRDYIQNQEKEDRRLDQLQLFR